MPGIDDLRHDDLRDAVRKVLVTCKGAKDVASAVSDPETRAQLLFSMADILGKERPVDTSVDRLEKTLALAGMALNRMIDHDAAIKDMSERICRAIEACRSGARPAPDAPRQAAEPASPVAPPARTPASSAGSATAQAPTARMPRSSPGLTEAEIRILHGREPIRLFADREPRRGGKLTAAELLLPAPEAGRSRRDFSSWVAGRPWSPDVAAIRLQPDRDDLVDEIAEFEAEMHAAPGIVLARPGMRPAHDPAGWDAAKTWLSCVARDIGVYAITTNRIGRRFSAALERIISQFHPGHAETLAAFDAHLVLGEDLYDTLCDAVDIETFYLRETGKITGRTQNLMGSISPSGEIREDLCLERGIFLHLIAGKPLAVGLKEAVAEFRLAQVLSGLPEDDALKIQMRFDGVFSRDCAQDLDAYRIDVEKSEMNTPDYPGY
jgi:hypothetical protein